MRVYGIRSGEIAVLAEIGADASPIIMDLNGDFVPEIIIGEGRRSVGPHLVGPEYAIAYRWDASAADFKEAGRVPWTRWESAIAGVFRKE